MLDDAELVAALRRGEEAVFADLVRRWSPAMLRLARLHVPTQAVAEEVVQDTWIAVLRGLAAFEARSSLRSWVFSILLNRARSAGIKERRAWSPFGRLGRRDPDAAPAVDPRRFQGARDEKPGWWATPPRASAVEELERAELRDTLLAAVADLPTRQREAIVMRDLLGFEPAEAAAAIGVSDGNFRVLLHRGRSRVRAAVEDHLDPDVAS
jgi:RNA polymerase sigma-70 factor (ECF subfamily)